MTFRFHMTGVRGRERRHVVFEEETEPSIGTPRLVIAVLEGEFTAYEFERIYAEALAKWMHPNEPPP
jgi:hypothetical protein